VEQERLELKKWALLLLPLLETLKELMKVQMKLRLGTFLEDLVEVEEVRMEEAESS